MRKKRIANQPVIKTTEGNYINQVFSGAILGKDQLRKFMQILKKKNCLENLLKEKRKIGNILHVIAVYNYVEVFELLIKRPTILKECIQGLNQGGKSPLEVAVLLDREESMVSELLRLYILHMDEGNSSNIRLQLKEIDDLPKKIFSKGYLSVFNFLSIENDYLLARYSIQLLEIAIQEGHEYIIQSGLNFWNSLINMETCNSFLESARANFSATSDPRLYKIQNILKAFILARKLILARENIPEYPQNEILDSICELDDYTINKWCNHEGYSLLDLTVKLGDRKVVENLLLQGEHLLLNRDTNKEKLTPLELAISNKNTEIALLLIQEGASLNKLNEIDSHEVNNLIARGVALSQSLPISFPDNGNIRIYNQFPYRYPGGLLTLIRDLPRIAALKVNAIWLNPIQKVSVIAKRNKDTGSLYAMDNPERFNSDFFKGIPNHFDRTQLIKIFTSTARALGLRPIFDLVLNHVGRETLLEGIMAQENVLTCSKWGEDTSGLSYSVESDEDRIIDILWRPYLEQYIELGFVGARIDAITNVSVRVQTKIYNLLRELCLKYNNTMPIIVGELMIKKVDESIKAELSLPGFTHIFVASSFYNDVIHGFENGIKYSNTTDCYGNTEFGLIKNAIEFQQDIIFGQKYDNIIGGSIGMSGNHDLGTFAISTAFHLAGYSDSTLHSRIREQEESNKIFQNTNKQLLRLGMKERIFCIALLCPGGWYLLAGDEYGLTVPARVFSNSHYNLVGLWPTEKQNEELDVSQHIQYVNAILENMPRASKGNWVNYFQKEVNGHLFRIVLRAENSDKPPVIACFYPEKITKELNNTLLGVLFGEVWKGMSFSSVHLIAGDMYYLYNKDSSQLVENILSELSTSTACLYIAFAEMIAFFASQEGDEQKDVSNIQDAFNQIKNWGDISAEITEEFFKNVFILLCKYDNMDVFQSVVGWSKTCGVKISHTAVEPLIEAKLKQLEMVLNTDQVYEGKTENIVNYVFEIYQCLLYLVDNNTYAEKFHQQVEAKLTSHDNCKDVWKQKLNQLQLEINNEEKFSSSRYTC